VSGAVWTGIATNTAPRMRKNAPMGMRKSSICYQKITLKAISATPTISASTAGRRCHGS
jgi:hypothetical protein